MSGIQLAQSSERQVVYVHRVTAAAGSVAGSAAVIVAAALVAVSTPLVAIPAVRLVTVITVSGVRLLVPPAQELDLSHIYI